MENKEELKKAIKRTEAYQNGLRKKLCEELIADDYGHCWVITEELREIHAILETVSRARYELGKPGVSNV